MPYTKPGVEISYVQGTISPNLTTPDLPACIIGDSYYVHDIDESGNTTYMDTYAKTTYTNAGSGIVTLSGMVNPNNIDTASVFVDLIAQDGSYRKTLTLNTDFTVSAIGVVTLLTGIGTRFVATFASTAPVIPAVTVFDNCYVKIGYRERRDIATGLVLCDSEKSVTNRFGQVSIANPLALGLKKALDNAGVAVYAYANSGLLNSIYATVISDLALNDSVYYLCPLSTDASNVHPAFQVHCDSMSSSTNKRERCLIAPKTVANLAAANKDTTVSTIATNAMSNQNRRAIWVYPIAAYIRTRIHLGMMTTAYLNNLNGTLGLNPLLASTVTINGVIYYENTEVTPTLWATLAAAASNLWYDVYVPVSNIYLAAAIAGQKSGLRPEQPVTNVPIAGFARLKYSNDWFSEAQLNVAAGGGTYWMTQRNVSAPIVCRHQLTTDKTSIQRQEFSILSALDFTGKFIRNGVEPYIGRNNITPSFLKFIQSVVATQGAFLVREGYLNSFKLENIAVDPLAADTILCTCTVGVKFPVNYIKFTLIF